MDVNWRDEQVGRYQNEIATTVWEGQSGFRVVIVERSFQTSLTASAACFLIKSNLSINFFIAFAFDCDTGGLN